MKTIRGYIYHMFPADIDTKTGEVTCDDNHWAYVYFGWLFEMIQFIIGTFSDMMDLEPYFVVKIYDKEWDKLTEKQKKEMIEVK